MYGILLQANHMDSNIKVDITISKPRGKQDWLTGTLAWWEKLGFQSQSTDFMLKSSQGKNKQTNKTNK